MAKYTKALAIDIETLGVGHDAVVIQIAAAVYTYTEKGAGKVLETLDVKPNIQNQLRNGRVISGDTTKFWLADAKRQKVFADIISAKGNYVGDALAALAELIKDHEVDEIWTQGPTFDIMILENMMKQYHQACPWKFYQIRDLRTVQEFVGHDEKSRAIKDSGVTHDAMDDVMTQIALHRHYIKKAAK